MRARVGNPAPPRAWGAEAVAVVGVLTGALVGALGGCAGADSAGVARAGAAPTGRAQAPAPAQTSMSALARRGEAIVRHTPDSLPGHVPGRIACGSCHLDAGRDPRASPLAGAWAAYPRYVARSGRQVTMVERVNLCVTRSLAGRALGADDPAMRAVLAYLAWMGDTPRPPAAAARPAAAGGQGARDEAWVPGDPARGRVVYARTCAECHGADGAGRGRAGAPGGVPALWGAGSFAIGASMAREGRLARFVGANMPLGRAGTLGARDAADVAAYVAAQARPDTPGKAGDWPLGGAPADVPYATRSGHAVWRAPRELLRHVE